jgi:hypothetical protein
MRVIVCTRPNDDWAVRTIGTPANFSLINDPSQPEHDDQRDGSLP